MPKVVSHGKLRRRRRKITIEFVDSACNVEGGFKLTEAQRLTISKVINAIISILTVLATKIFC